MSELRETDSEGGPLTQRLVARLTTSVVAVVRRLPPAGPRPAVIAAPCLLVPENRPNLWSWRLVPTVSPPKLPPELAERIFGDGGGAGRPVNLTLTVQPVRSSLPRVRPWMTINPSPLAGPVHITLVFPRGERRCFSIGTSPGAPQASATSEPLHPHAFAFPRGLPVRVAICDRPPPPPRLTRVHLSIRFSRSISSRLGRADQLRLLARVIRALSASDADERTMRPLVEFARGLGDGREASRGTIAEADRRLLAAILGTLGDKPT